jgi:hypothetical protein
MLEAVRIFAISSILWTARRLDVSGLPGLGAESTKKSGGMRGAGANFHVIRLKQRATLVAPITLQGKNYFLEGMHEKALSALAKYKKRIISFYSF